MKKKNYNFTILAIIFLAFILIYLIVYHAKNDTFNKQKNKVEETKIEMETTIEETKEEETEVVEEMNISPKEDEYIYYDFVNTNNVDNYTNFISTNNKNENAGKHAVLINMEDFNKFMEETNLDSSNPIYQNINEDYFKYKFIIVTIDSFEENYLDRTFLNFNIKDKKMSINYEKNSKVEETEEKGSGYWIYMIGVDFETVGESEIHKLPIAINIEDEFIID